MSIAAILKDFIAWTGEVADHAAAQRPPARALAAGDGGAVVLRLDGTSYAVERAASQGDSGPLFLSDEQALTMRFETAPEAALHGAAAARVEAARRAPFPLEEAVWSLAPAPAAWQGGAPWRFAAAPARRVATLSEQVAACGARPGAPFVLFDGAPSILRGGGQRQTSRGARLTRIAALVAVIAAAAAAGSVVWGAGRIEAAAETRLANARVALDQAEAQAAEAQAARDAAAAPIRAAQAAAALLVESPPAAKALAALTAAVPDDAHARRLTISPGAAEGEFIAPDAAALAALLARAPAVSAAQLKTAARTDPATGLQRAVLSLTLSREAGE